MCKTLSSSSTLWVVATPLGNLGDFSPRAIETLNKSDLILAEDTRRARSLLQKIGVLGKNVLSLHEHNEQSRIGLVLDKLAQGSDVALISDAGTPLISDPGYKLVSTCREHGFNVSPVPGPCAPIAALMACGLPPYPFTFIGFLPRKKGEIKKTFQIWEHVPSTIVFFERKNRIISSLQVAYEVLGPRQFCLARELTKKFEEFIFGTLDKIELDEERLKGEITAIIGPGSGKTKTSLEDVLDLIEQNRQKGLRAREIVHKVSGMVKGWSGKEIYKLVQSSRSKGEKVKR
ncbi:16S rRNA (cytidine(1402)-2'-O)-methyltransferase [Desulfohalobiaceae bacterium Ax17]|jgi:16S rRNA (cytidine1402-2'-O)-methyltransferase|uniref:16S rRNA (cytidine(1402)-2'-O)-methyltransferase n=1 Tax=Desulfovulcanus ferrireducens TaxID=2831190 RepID=UPI00207B9A75|nr:16S rRNA (cytidine(1402)-2'-O)-methyltransferase [Desulfovulcanus ferrireducens]MBT8764228.1 16S rRNA (cytidine(1402)-2'-O)-methyltransferase [Desulfovulcanus ferrireducens]